MGISPAATSPIRIQTGQLDVSRAIPAQVEKAFADGSAKLRGKDFMHTKPPVKDFAKYPHYPARMGVDVSTTAYVIKGKVYALQHHASGGFNVWFDIGKAPKAPAL
jgi:hypothetical protein